VCVREGASQSKLQHISAERLRVKMVCESVVKVCWLVGVCFGREGKLKTIKYAIGV
jgi:hypothetical protein